MWLGAVMANVANGAFAVLRINAQICVGTLKSHLGICFLVFQSLRCDTCPFFNHIILLLCWFSGVHSTLNDGKIEADIMRHFVVLKS